MKKINKTLLPMLALGLASSVSATVFTQFEFNEVNNAGWSTSLDTVGGLNFNDNANAFHDGAGNLVFSGNVANQNLSVGGSVVSQPGVGYLRIDLASWDTSSSGFDFQFGLRLSRDQSVDGVTNGNVVNKINLNGTTDDKNNIVVTQLNNGDFLGTSFAMDSVNTGGQSIIVGYDLGADEFSVWHDLGRDGTYTLGIDGQALNIGGVVDFDQVNAITLDTTGGSYALDFLAYGDNLAEIQTLTPAAVPESSTYALIAGMLALTSVMIGRRK